MARNPLNSNDMHRFNWLLALMVGLLVGARSPAPLRAETETIDLKALAKKARPAVMLLIVSDANGKEIATGTGFLVSSDGKLITNHHVIEGAASAVAKAENGALFVVEGVLADDPKNDLVLLKLGGRNFPFLSLGSSERIDIGTRIAVIGSPLGLEGTMSEGIVSALRELIADLKMLQVTAAISPGSSGSPVLNAKGDVVGVASALLRGGQALNFAVPVECATRLLVKVQSFTKPQPLQQSASSGEYAIYSDADWRAAAAAEASEDYVEMLKLSKALVSRYPENAAAYFSLGVAYGHLNFTVDEIAAFQQTIKLMPDDAMAWCNLGVAYNRSGRTDDEIVAYRQAIKLKPDYAMAWYNLGTAYYKAGDSEDAIGAFRQAIKLKPDYASAWYNLGVVYRTKGEASLADYAFSRAKVAGASRHGRELESEETNDASSGAQPGFVLQGITHDGRGSEAMINGVTVREGDTIKGARVTSIARREVKLDFNGREIVVSLPW